MSMTPLQQRTILILLLAGLVTITAGVQYSISAWSPQMKAELNCTQSQIELVGTLGNVGSYLGPLTGVVVYELPELWVALICLVCSVVGILPMALAMQSTVGPFSHLRNTTILGFCFAFAGFGSATLYSLLLTVNLGNFLPHRRGTIVAFISCLVGLSAAIYTAIYNGPLQSNVANFLYLLMGVMVCSTFGSALFIRRIDLNLTWKGDGRQGLLGGEEENQQTINSDGKQAYALAQYHDPADVDHGSSSRSDSRASSSASFVSSDSLDFSDPEDRLDAALAEQEREQQRFQLRVCGGGRLGSFFGAIYYLMHTSTFWLLITIFFLIAGTGLQMINNVGHIVQSLNGGEQDGSLTTFLILILSLANGFGRLIMICTDFVPLRKGVWLLAMCILMSCAHFANAFLITSKEYVIFGVIGCAMAYGGLWTIVPIIISDNFGASSFSMNFGWIDSVSGVASLLFNYLAGKFYDDQTPPGQNECAGTNCYRTSFIIAGSAAGVAAILAAILVPKTKLGKRNKFVPAGRK